MHVVRSEVFRVPVVRLRVDVKGTIISKIAPQLPPGYVWEPGMEFDLIGFEHLHVEARHVKESGDIDVWLEDPEDIDLNSEEIQQLLNSHGWIVD